MSLKIRLGSRTFLNEAETINSSKAQELIQLYKSKLRAMISLFMRRLQLVGITFGTIKLFGLNLTIMS